MSVGKSTAMSPGPPVFLPTRSAPKTTSSPSACRSRTAGRRSSSTAIGRGGPAADVSLRRRGRQLTFQVGPCRGGALVFGADGALTGWEGRGTLTVDGTPWLEAGCDLLVYSADAAPIVAANCLVVLPLGPGGVRLHRAGAACGAVAAEVGEVTAGAWRTLRALTLERAGAGAGASVRWSALDARGMVLVGTPAAVAEAARGVAAELHR